VDQVVEARSEADVEQVADHTQVWPEKQEKKEDPASVQFVIHRKTQGDGDEAFRAKKASGIGEHLPIVASPNPPAPFLVCRR